ncbi:IGF-like family receptor 1 isoform 2-T2 [Polymixia lowei]
MVYSKNCKNLTTYWNLNLKECVPCDMSWIKPGYEFTPNCGYVDDGGRRDSSTRDCGVNTFNTGSFEKCRPCTLCQDGSYVRLCNATTDAQCCQQGRNCPNDAYTMTTNEGSMVILPATVASPTPAYYVRWTVPVIIIACIMVVVASYIITRRKRGFWFRGLRFNKDGHQTVENTQGPSPDEAFYLSIQPDNKDLDDILSPQVQSAPLQRVLDNLDVLEELVILLDPESHSVKNTRHLASHCSFPSTWITYTYSMKDSKSPLTTVLEGVTSKYPDWTVGHLGKLLKQMGRNDAITVLSKLTLNENGE